jgi:hypothetical protein
MINWVRLEIGNALTRKIRVVPVLVEEAQLPAPSELPEDLQPLTRRHAVELRESAWGSQVTHLIDGLERALGVSRAPPDAHPPPTSQTQAGWTVRLRERSQRERTLELRGKGAEHLLFFRGGFAKSRVVLDGKTIPSFRAELRTLYEIGNAKGSASLVLPMTLTGPLGDSQCVLAFANGFGGLSWLTLEVNGQLVYEEGSPPD